MAYEVPIEQYERAIGGIIVGLRRVIRDVAILETEMRFLRRHWDADTRALVRECLVRAHAYAEQGIADLGGGDA